MGNTHYLPALIVAKDSEGNFIHMREAEENTTYICPCCGGHVKLRALDSDYVQKHFYHCDGSSCSAETISHWLYKNWLFENGSQFYAGGELFTVDSIEIEKTYDTRFGNYRPDITVITTSGQTLFFEINFSNKKNDSYSCKWDELGNDVIEVDIKNLLEADYKNETPKFSYVYKDGSYQRKYMARQKKDLYSSTVGVQKQSISKDISRFARLDDFWVQATKYKYEKQISISPDLLNSFGELQYEDKLWACEFIKKIRCNDLREYLINEVNKLFYRNLDCLVAEQRAVYPELQIKITQYTAQTYCVDITYVLTLNDKPFKRFSLEGCTIRSRNKIFTFDDLDIIRDFLTKGTDELYFNINQIKKLSGALQKTYIDFTAHNDSDKIDADFFANVHNKAVSEKIGHLTYSFYYLKKREICADHSNFESRATRLLDYEFAESFILNSSDFKDLLDDLSSISDTLYLTVSAESQRYETCLYSDNVKIETFYLMRSNSDCIQDVCAELKDIIIPKAKNYMEFVNNLYKVCGRINSCKNGFWEASVVELCDRYELKLQILGTEVSSYVSFSYCYGYEEITDTVTDVMNRLIDGTYCTGKYRFFNLEGLNE